MRWPVPSRVRLAATVTKDKWLHPWRQEHGFSLRKSYEAARARLLLQDSAVLLTPGAHLLGTPCPPPPQPSSPPSPSGIAFDD